MVRAEIGVEKDDDIVDLSSAGIVVEVWVLWMNMVKSVHLLLKKVARAVEVYAVLQFIGHCFVQRFIIRCFKRG